MKYEDLPEAIPMGKCTSIILNQKYNMLTPLFRVSNKGKATRFACKCDCGEYTIVHASHLKTGHTKSCGCLDHPNLIGKKFGRLTVLDIFSKGDGRIWKCQCECGKITKVRTRDLITGHTKSCGCYSLDFQREKYENLIGQKFGRLTVLERIIPKQIGEEGRWKCQCECGTIITTPKTTDLKSGKVQSCGCLKSKGELLLGSILSENNIKFEKEKTFETCRFPNTNMLAKFDFYLPDYNAIIEYDGEQHFSECSGIFSYIPLKQRQERDAFKNQWCKNNNIKMIRIPYWDLFKINIDYINNLLL